MVRCLEDHMKAQQFSSSCRSLVYSEQKQQVSKLKFNAPLLSACDTALRRCGPSIMVLHWRANVS